MTEAAAPRAFRFPVGLTIATLIALAILVGLGVWQVKRLAWKTDMLARIAALQNAPAQPLEAVLARATKGEDVEYTRVVVDCPGVETAGFDEIYAVIDGAMASRLVSPCPIQVSGFEAILVDRGYVLDSSVGRPPMGRPIGANSVVGVLRKGDRNAPKFDAPPAKPVSHPTGFTPFKWYGRHLPSVARHLGVRQPAPYFLMAETSTNPDFKLLVPKGLPTDIPNNHLSYALTWFGLALGLAGVYAALLWRRVKGQ